MGTLSHKPGVLSSHVYHQVGKDETPLKGKEKETERPGREGMDEGETTEIGVGRETTK